MEKRELREAHCPILKPVPEEVSTPPSPAATQTPPAPPPQAPEERRVAFDIGDSEDADDNNRECRVAFGVGDSEDGENKERRVAFAMGDADDTDDSSANGGQSGRGTARELPMYYHRILIYYIIIF